ncbi:MAG: HEAT repeat domain-containing protein [Planctomycetes bacterium]|nr:HEAT repeat domain-containing protein [Planctomycetota bacterium]
MRPSRASAWLSVPLALALAACSSTPPDPAPVRDPSLEAEYRERAAAIREAEEKRKELPRLLLDLDKTIEKYSLATYNSGSPRAEESRERIGHFIEETAKENFDALLAAATDASTPRNRAIALAAIAFTGRRDALDPLLNGVADPNPEVSNNAAFGLGILQEPSTPSRPLERIMNDQDRPLADRANAAWALHRVQLRAIDAAPFVAIWTALLAGALDAQPDAITTTAIRGLGETRDPEHSALVLRYLQHPTPLVRMAAAVALGRLGDLAAVEPLLALLGTAEPVQNVRFAAMKALRDLAGGRGEGYDVEEWRRIFELGRGTER